MRTDEFVNQRSLVFIFYIDKATCLSHNLKKTILSLLGGEKYDRIYFKRVEM